MHKKIIELKKEIEQDAVKIPYALKTLDAIAQHALQQGDMNSKRLADEAFAMLPLYKENQDDLYDVLTSLQVSIAQPVIKRLEKKLLEEFDYDLENYDNSIVSYFFTDRGTLFLWIMDRWSDSEDKFKVDAVIIDNGKEEIIEYDKLVKDDNGEGSLEFIMDALRDMGY